MALENVIINELQFDDIFKIETLTKPLSFAELNLIKMLVKRWQFFVYSRRLLKQYFHKWKIYHKMTSVTQNETTAEKIDLLISELHKMKVKRKKFIRSNSDSMSHQKSQEKSISSECFKNRFKTQKEIIDLQKAKLEQQSRIIEDLKMGIIKDELSKSLQNTKSELREIFSKSSSKVKCKMAPHGIKLEDTLANFIVKSNKAPKFMQQMERRALERAKNREIIRERKRIIDEEKQRALEEIIEQKRIHDEEEKRRNLEAIKEKQRAELEKQKILQLNKDKYFADLKRANYFCKIKTLKRYFARLQCNVYITKNNMLRAENFHEKKTKQNSINRWRKFIDEKYRKQNEKADALFKQRALKQVWQQWRNFYKESIQNTQVALDFYDIKLLHNVFVHWHRFVCTQYILEQKNLRKALLHYKNRIVVHYFYQWKSLPAVVQLERAKEEKKKKWREKVKEIIPDYSPPKLD